MQDVRDWSLVASAAAFVLAGGAGWLIAGRITRSISHLRDAAHHLDLRDLSRRVPVEGRDEIADLGASFNKMADRLEAEERSRRQLLADVAHEPRHPLAVMQGRLELMQDGRVDLEPEALLPLEDEVIRMTRLVGDLRDLSLAEVGGLSLNLTTIDVGALLERLLVNLEPVAEAKAITLTANAAPDLPPITADADRIRQVLLNLIANALQYTEEGGKVTVDAVRDGDSVRIAVADTGPGISPEDLLHVFDRFYRADKSRSRATGGSGLGLAIVRSLVELHKGQISVRSQPGEGTCFTVILPASRG
jgi:signal transduction histidine kinase